MPALPSQSIVIVELANLVKEALIKGLSAQRAAEELDVEATFLECQCQLVGDDGLVLVETACPSHLFLEHASEQLGRLVGLGQAHIESRASLDSCRGRANRRCVRWWRRRRGQPVAASTTTTASTATGGSAGGQCGR